MEIINKLSTIEQDDLRVFVNSEKSVKRKEIILNETVTVSARDWKLAQLLQHGYL